MSKSLMLSGLLLTGVTLSSFSQTKHISFKSHSGNMMLFNDYLSDPSHDLVNHNLGMAPTIVIQNAVIDSLIFVSDSVAVMVTSEYCTELPRGMEYAQDSLRLKPGFDPSKDYYTSIWEEGTDTVYNHPLFSKQHELEMIKEKLKTEYNFKNDIDCTVFIGYDSYKTDAIQSTREKQQERNAPIITDQGPGKNTPLYGISLLLLFLSPLLFVIYRITRRQQELYES